MEEVTNTILLSGTAMALPELSHVSRGESFFVFPLQVHRLSGADDILNVQVRQALSGQIIPGEHLTVTGEVRSFNNRSGVGSRLVITVFARQVERTPGEGDLNSVRLCGTVCKPTIFRRTPMGRMISDIMLAVSRRYGRSDYLPCIAWGNLAQRAEKLTVGQMIRLEGRMQSRNYIKQLGEQTQQRTAYEISAIHLERM